MALKRALAIHDISCFGKCSLTVALPILSAAGIETPVIPTAVLSTHTGGFTGFTYRDLTEDILPIKNHWQTLSLDFDAIYTGFLGSFEQIDIVSQVFDALKSDKTLIVVDPVMADYGKLYTIFPPDFPKGMKKLCAKADVIVPNVTEAYLLLDREYKEGPYTKQEIDDLLKSLAEMGAKKVVVTGAYFDEGTLGAASYDSITGETSFFCREKIEPMFHGTGDVFASVLTAALLKDKTLSSAVKAAVTFTVNCIERTKVEEDRNQKGPTRYGVDFESGLSSLKALIES